MIMWANQLTNQKPKKINSMKTNPNNHQINSSVHYYRNNNLNLSFPNSHGTKRPNFLSLMTKDISIQY